jgi:serine/threonine-protein kinase
MSADADRNLLFGVLALQAGLVDAAQFAEACAGWAARKDTSLADLMVERRLLTAGDRAQVNDLLERKVKKHASDVRASLLAVSGEEARRLVAQAADPQARLTIAPQTPSTESGTTFTVAYEPRGRGRYTLVRLHAKGGIGQVWLARDKALGREVALKELHADRADSAAALARFLEEARITGQLEHPAIVPVHELVEHSEDGKPFYTMRFVKGRTLADAVQAYHQKRQAGHATPMDLRELLSVFVAVCNAVAYAHSRGVLHRDLKPQNVVLGDYGEVIVLDWGLAKLVAQPEADAELEPVSVGPGGSRDHSVQGQVSGTPGYMPPEQATGRRDLIDARSDVYGLGAVLYEMLTGQPPFAGEDTQGVLRQVAQEAPIPPRQRVPAAPRPLEAVCLKALAKKQADRYASAREVAQEAERWLADEPVTAYREPVAARLGRWRRRHPAVSAVAALLAAGLVGGALWLERDRETRALAADRRVAAVSADLEEAALRQGQAQWAEARAAVARAEGRLGADAAPALGERVHQAAADLDMVTALEDIRLQRAQVKGAGVDTETADAAYTSAFAAYGVPVATMESDAAAARLAQSAVRDYLIGALYDWTESVPDKESRRRDRLLAVAAKADGDRWRRHLGELLARPNRTALEALARGREALLQPPATLVVLARALRRVKASEDAIGLLRKVQELYPTDFWVNHNLALYLLYGPPGRADEAVAYLRAAVAVRPQSSLAHGNLGFALRQQGKLAEAAAEYRKVIALQPDNVLAHGNLGFALLKEGKLTEAEEVLRRATVLAPENRLILFNLAEVLQGQGRYAEALALTRRGHEIASRDPNWRQPSAEWVLEAERLVALAEKLPAVLQGRTQPANADERVALADLCRQGPKRFYAAAARFYAEAFTEKPVLANDVRGGRRYNAACAAALAAGGRGDDAGTLTASDRARWRGQSLRWLRADLDWWNRLAEAGKPEDRALTRQTLTHWQDDPELADVRDIAVLAALPADESQSCRKLWSDVAALVRRYAGP